jgi:hypothetical protein
MSVYNDLEHYNVLAMLLLAVNECTERQGANRFFHLEISKSALNLDAEIDCRTSELQKRFSLIPSGV